MIPDFNWCGLSRSNFSNYWCGLNRCYFSNYWSRFYNWFGWF